MADLRFQVSIPTDEGFLGRECHNSDCARYFRVHADSIKEEMHCPYCGQQSQSDDLWTKDQVAYLRESAAEQAKEYISSEFAKMFEQQTRSSEFISFKRSSPYRAKQVTPKYVERKVDTELRCPACSSRFQVDGIFAYCVGCGIENIAIYDANLAIIRTEVEAGGDSQRVLRHAYNDLVSTFEAVCAKRARSLTSQHGSFQDPYDARRFFNEHAKVDILSGFGIADLLLLRRIFHKRHAYQHTQGYITERYVKKVPEDRDLVGTLAVLSLGEFEAGAGVVRQMIDTLVAGLGNRRAG